MGQVVNKTYITNDLICVPQVAMAVVDMAATVVEDMVEVDKAMETAVGDMVVEDMAAVAAMVMTTITMAVVTLVVSLHFEC